MTIKEQVLQTIINSSKALFAEDVTHLMPNIKLNTIVAACSTLLEEGRLKAKLKNRQDSRIAALYYVREAQLIGMEGLMPYERKRRPGMHRDGGPKPGDILIALPLGKSKTELFTLAQARSLYEELKAVFDPKGKA